jgi:hypothetical protein
MSKYTRKGRIRTNFLERPALIVCPPAAPIAAVIQLHYLLQLQYFLP